MSTRHCLQLILGLLLLGGDLVGDVGVLLDELRQLLKGALALHLKGPVLLVLGRVEEDGGEALHDGGQRGVLVGGTVHLRDDDGLDVLEALAKLLVNGSQLLAVPAPGGVDLEHDVLGRVVHHRVEGLAHHSQHGAVVLLGDVLGLEVGRQLAGDELLGVGHHRLHGVLVGVLVLDALLVLHHEAHELHRLHLAGLHTKVLQHRLNLLRVRVHRHEDALAGELRGHGAGGGEHLLRVVAAVEEQHLAGDAAAEDAVRVLLVEGDHQRQLVLPHERAERLLLQRALEGHVAAVELLEHDGRGNLEGVHGCHLSGDGVHEHHVSVVARHRHVCVELRALQPAQVGEHDNLLILGVLLQISDELHQAGRRAGLALHPRNDVRSGTSTIVLGHLAVLEPLQGGVALNIELLGDFTVDGGIELGDHDGLVILLDLGRGLGVLGRQLLTVAAPGCIELNQHERRFLDDRCKVVLGQNDDIFVVFRIVRFIVVIVLVKGWVVIVLAILRQSGKRRLVQDQQRKKRQKHRVLPRAEGCKPEEGHPCSLKLSALPCK
mmetsp:Transcript_11029/g.22986  ORF Transcript_11029/g.22986 Transcript_11029/m.22986 type:complete len:548 (-) Transcript_11029:62-1705(-)